MTDMYLKTYDLAKSKNIQIVNISISDEENKFSFFYNPQDNIRLTNKINSFQKQNNNGFIIVKSAGNHTCNLSYALKIANKMPEKNKDEFFDLYQNKSTEKILSKLLQYKEIFKAIRAHLSVFSYDNSFVNEIIVASLSASGITSSYSSIGSNLWITGIGGGDSSTLKSDGIFRLAQEEHADAPRLLTTKIFGRKFNPSITEFDENLSSEYSKNSYTTEFQGTSAAAPTVSGIIALLLQANPNLSSRDIKYILAKTANNAKILPDPLPSCIKILAKLNIFHPDFIKPWNTEWIKNKAGFYFHNFYGFGLIDASKAIEIAENYKSTFNDKPSIEYLYKSESLKKLKKISPGESLIHKINSLKNIIIEAVYVIPYIDAPRADSLAIEIQSPEMTNSIILYPGNSFIKLKKNEKKIKNMKYKLNHYKENDNNNLGSYLTNAFYGEKSGGDWSIKITNYDKKENVKLNGWKLKIIGYEE
ncbi:S8 family serine peptidase [Silvanigrella aquatica]|uniref:P/Homo B domain-containing protein n=1 Tax=Silvanigrella aquatica TaxID=1915309 RepID=A0A1L4CY69_9BACT|nr:S8 family serine peptidase [Silvanigrella aquatica]APJ02894.1 hypothetical protein AXG55_02735 [Silvanigrella aquatica]